MKRKYFKEFERLRNLDRYCEKSIANHEKEVTEVISPLYHNWKNFAENELEILLKKFGNICRNETSVFREAILSDNDLAETLLKIGDTFHENNKILIQIVSSIHDMHARYKLEITNKIYQFFIKQTQNKKVNFFVSIFIATYLSLFTNYEHIWKYIMSMPDISPKKKSIDTFYTVINNNIDIVPCELKTEIIKVFENYINKTSLHPYIVTQYSTLIQKLKEK